jgi:ABC-2 type transport system ATP-binding protein
MLTVQNITFSYKRKSVLSGLSLSIEAASIVGLVAPNGAGKTTLLRAIAGIVSPKTGVIEIDGIQNALSSRYKRKLFFIESKEMMNPDLRAIDYLQAVKSLWRSEVSITQAIEEMDIGSFYKRNIGSLSLGMSQQVILALCRVSDAPYLLLDEPMNGLDPTNTKRASLLFEALRSEGKTVLMSSHLLSNVDSLCDQVCYLKDGGIAMIEERDAGVFSSAETYERLYPFGGETT